MSAFAFKITRRCCVPLGRRSSTFPFSSPLPLFRSIFLLRVASFPRNTAAAAAPPPPPLPPPLPPPFASFTLSQSQSRCRCRCSPPAAVVYFHVRDVADRPRHARFANLLLKRYTSRIPRDSPLFFHEFQCTPKYRRGDSKLHPEVRRISRTKRFRDFVPGYCQCPLLTTERQQAPTFGRPLQPRHLSKYVLSLRLCLGHLQAPPICRRLEAPTDILSRIAAIREKRRAKGRGNFKAERENLRRQLPRNMYSRKSTMLLLMLVTNDLVSAHVQRYFLTGNHLASSRATTLAAPTT